MSQAKYKLKIYPTTADGTNTHAVTERIGKRVIVVGCYNISNDEFVENNMINATGYAGDQIDFQRRTFIAQNNFNLAGLANVDLEELEVYVDTLTAQTAYADYDHAFYVLERL